MLTKEDLQAIAELMDKKMEPLQTQLRELNQQVAVMENTSEKQVSQIADGHKMLADKMGHIEQKLDAIQSDVDEIKGELVTQELVITRRLRKI